MSVGKAWRVLLGLGGFLTHFDGERVFVAGPPSGRSRSLWRNRALTFNCQVR